MFCRKAHLLSWLVLALLECQSSAWTTTSLPTRRATWIPHHATLAPQDTIKVSNDQHDLMLSTLGQVSQDAKDYADDFGLGETESAIYALFSAIRKANIPLGLKGEPFVLRRDDILKAINQPNAFDHFFTLQDFAKAVQDDFLDAARGSTDNRKGWKVSARNFKGRYPNDCNITLTSLFIRSPTSPLLVENPSKTPA